MNLPFTAAGTAQNRQPDPGSRSDRSRQDEIAQLQAQLAAERDATREIRHKLDLVTRAGVAFSSERDVTKIMETTLNTARELTNAAGGTIYMLEEISAGNPVDPGEIASRELKFVCLQNETLRAAANSDTMELMPPVPLELTGEPNLSNVSAYCANTGEVLNFADVYDARGFDFSGTRAYDTSNNYRSRSMLVIPLEDHENNIIGVLQLINRRHTDGAIIEFSVDDIDLVKSVSHPAAASITTQRLIADQVGLFNAFVTVLAEGLGEKSAHTFNHIRRVAALGEAMSESLSHWDEGIYKDISYSADEMAEMRLAGWLHDIGKLTTPEHIVSKQAKLQLVMDRFELIVERFNSKRKDYRIDMLEQQLQAAKRGEPEDTFTRSSRDYDIRTQELEQYLHALLPANCGAERMPAQQVALVEELGRMTLESYFSADVIMQNGYPVVGHVTTENHLAPLIDSAERDNLLIRHGTLNQAERAAINNHADRSWRWLMALPFPRKQRRLPLYAGAHHEHLNGSGHPNGLSAVDLPLQSRILAIADIYEALVANDRPYKQAMKLSEAMDVLGGMVRKGNLDAEVMAIFLKSGGYLEFAREHLDPHQIDSVDIDAWMANYYVEPLPPRDLLNQPSVN
jgi:HD-GYP domain-containing protein (c-di-GMP phosphodiesterase class II)